VTARPNAKSRREWCNPPVFSAGQSHLCGKNLEIAKRVNDGATRQTTAPVLAWDCVVKHIPDNFLTSQYQAQCRVVGTPDDTWLRCTKTRALTSATPPGRQHSLNKVFHLLFKL